MRQNDERHEIARRLLIAGAFVLLVALGGAAGFHELGASRWSWPDCLYMTLITMSTVGYAETLEGLSTTPGARLWTGLLIIIGSGSLVFFISTFTAFIVEGDIRGALRRNRMKKRIDALENHVIVVGAGATGIHVLSEVAASGTPFVVVDTNEERLRFVAQQIDPNMLYVHGDATLDTVLEQAGVNRAKGLAATLREDKDNVFVAITARALNPKLRIVAKVTEDNADTKLRRAGADAIVSPSLIGGQRLASELVRPSAVQFMDRMRSHDLRVEEVPIPEGSPLIGATLHSTPVRHQKNVLVLAVREPDESYSFNPGPDFVLTRGQTLVVLARSEDIQNLRKGIAEG